MSRTTISLPEELLRRIRLLAAERGVSMAAFVREAVEEKAAAARPKPRSIGIAESSGQGYTARDAGEIEFEPRPWRSS